jgi:hypothetical protein
LNDLETQKNRSTNNALSFPSSLVSSLTLSLFHFSSVFPYPSNFLFFFCLFPHRKSGGNQELRDPAENT